MDDIDRIAAELAIRNVLARIAQASDNAENVDDYVNLFTEDAVWEMPENPAIGMPGSAKQGRAEIAAGVHERRGTGMQGPGSRSQHFVTTTAVEVDGDSAKAYSYFMYVVSEAAGPVMRTVGRYDDTMRRTPAGWQLAHRIIHFG